MTDISHRRGQTFKLEFDLSTGWTASMFTGGVVFTLRDGIPESSTVDDDDAIAQVSVADGGITFPTTTHGLVKIPAADTNSWPIKLLYWDVSVKITAEAEAYVLDSGTCRIIADIGRSV